MAKSNISDLQFPKVYELTVSLNDTVPFVTRKFLVHEIIHLDELHMVLQLTMGWNDVHSYQFTFAEKSYAPADFAADTGMLSDEEVTLQDALGSLKEFEYVYDHGDYWEHTIKISKVLEHDPRLTYPACVGGENACPPEDCGGLAGFENLKDVLAGKESPEKDELLKWVGGFYNPTTFDPNFVNQYLLWREED